MAQAVGADVVVVHPPFRWQKDYAAGFVEGIASLEARTGIAFAVENMYPWRASSRRGMEMYLPGWDPSEESYAHTTIDLSHAAIAKSDVVEMAERMGSSLRHVHLTDGSGSAKDEHLVPGALVAEACMDIFDLRELEICPWALREGVILERLDQISVVTRPH